MKRPIKSDCHPEGKKHQVLSARQSDIDGKYLPISMLTVPVEEDSGHTAEGMMNDGEQ